MYTYTHVCTMYLWTLGETQICTHVHTYVYACTFKHEGNIHMYVHMYVYPCIHMDMGVSYVHVKCVHAYNMYIQQVHVAMYVHTYVHTYVHM